LPAFDQNERIAILALTGLLIARSIVSSINYFWLSAVDDFEVRKQAIPVPPVETLPEGKTETPDLHAQRVKLTATTKELTPLPQIEPKADAQILKNRKIHCEFKSIEELTAVKGIGAHTIEKLRDRITIGTP
jgi:competence ComEA-like helix-hairpin-helix protein